ncbi:MAG: hypothetical protein ABEJ79_06505 [Halolamina sp.]
MRGRRPLAALAMVALLVAGASTGAVAASGSVELDAALSEQSKTDELTFTFTPSQDATVTATDRIERANGNVTFAFDEWERTDGQGSGTNNSWDVVAGVEYRVTYVATARSGAAEDTYFGTAEVTASDGSLVADESLSLQVDVLYPQFGFVDRQSTEVVFDDADLQSASSQVSFPVPNSGQGVMKPTDVSVSNLPQGFTVASTALPDTVSPGSEGEGTVELAVDDDVNEGTYSFDVTVTDSLGNQRSFAVDATVSKPPIADVSDTEANLGDVLVGQTSRKTFSVSETAGFEGLSGVTVDDSSAEQDATLDFEGLSRVSTQPSGSDTATAVVDVSSDARQHETLSWTVQLSGEAPDSPTRQVEFEARVIYPARLGTVEASSTTLPFDEPRDQVSAQDGSTTVSVENTGDLEMDVTGVDVTMQSGSQDISARAVDVPDTVAGLSSQNVTIRYRADADTPEGSYDAVVTVRTADAGTQTVETTVEVTQSAELVVDDRMQFGEVTITSNQTRSADVAERLGYEDVTGLTVEVVSGPEEWLTLVQQPPSRLDAGTESSLVAAVRFDTEAELYTEYTWTIRVDGEDVEPQTVTISATAKPYSFDRVTEPLGEYSDRGDWRAETASGTLSALSTLESDLRGDGSVADGDLSSALAAGRATLLFIESIEDARTAQEDGEYAGAQENLTRAAAARDLLVQYVDAIQSDEVRSAARESLQAANASLSESVAAQRGHYQDVLADDPSAFERARAHRALARLATITGDETTASEHREQYEAASDRYVTLVQNASTARAEAGSAWTAYRAEATLVVAGYPLVLNPARLDTTLARTSRVNRLYAEAETMYAEAGATAEAEAVNQRAATVSSRATVSRYVLYGTTGAYGIGFLAVVARLSLNAYAFVQDTAAAATGDFLR